VVGISCKKKVENDVAMTRACNGTAAIGCRSCLSAPPNINPGLRRHAPQEGGGRMQVCRCGKKGGTQSAQGPPGLCHSCWGIKLRPRRRSVVSATVWGSGVCNSMVFLGSGELHDQSGTMARVNIGTKCSDAIQRGCGQTRKLMRLCVWGAAPNRTGPCVPLCWTTSNFGPAKTWRAGKGNA